MIERIKTWATATAWPLLQRTFKEWGNDDCGRLAASLAYYAVFSIFPLMLLMVSLLGFWLRFSGAEDPSLTPQAQVLASIESNISKGVADSLRTVLSEVELGAGAGSLVAFITVLFAASSIFTQLDTAFDRIWNVPQPESQGILHTVKTTLIDRGKAFLLVLAIGGLLIGSVILTTVLNALGTYAERLPAGAFGWQLVNLGVGMLLNALVFALLFYYLPKPKCRWSDVFPAALLTAVLWEIGKQALSIYLGRSTYTAYAAVGALIILMLWIYYACYIVF
ncbi:MAG TPA: YihY/virulence factor BrkB family protein, partial [Herpetosiphonaceae bacterium]